MSTHRLPLDWAHTTRDHPGESIDDTRNLPGYGVIELGIATLGMALVAAGYGFEGWAIIAGAVCAVCFMAGASVVVAEHAHVKYMEHNRLGDPLGH